MRDKSLELRLQLAGLDVPFSGQMNHVLFMPEGFRLELGDQVISIEDYATLYNSSSDFLNDTLYFVWDSAEIVTRQSANTVDCLFDLSGLGELVPNAVGVAEDGDGDEFLPPQFIAGVFQFVQKWGILHGDDSIWTPPDRGECEAGHWLEPAITTRSVLLGLAATEAGEEFSEVLLEVLSEHWIDEEYRRIADIQSAQLRTKINRGASWADGELYATLKQDKLTAQETAREAFETAWQRARRERRTIEFQRSLLATAMRAHMSPTFTLVPAWDSRGRLLELEAEGAATIAAVHLYTLFGSPRLGVAVCSICGKPYALDEDSRKPRAGTRRFCSDDCRESAKREDKLAAWHRNKFRWRPERKGQ